ncbi:alpha/beta fold hydrolase [Affinirhizobium pseudoryzae]|uniref:alpha/beta fold hydrolase n=1 Tax=Allorhizobium pseudoryzae TaxID=379684 RepID=UPI0013EA1325|nr:alpha/beta hydrolase [Allorhizobium pseudoryzae]
MTLSSSRFSIGLAALAVGSGLLAAATPRAAGAADHRVLSHHVSVDGLNIHYRESGSPNGPVLLLLHGFPSSSHMFRDLMPLIDPKYRVIAPDYPGFGYSAAPDPAQFSYDFSRVTDVMDDFLDVLGATSYVIYMQDFGGPVGMRLAVKHPERVRGLIVQNATFHAEGWNPDVAKNFGPFWKARTAETEKPLRGFLAAETTKWQYTQGAVRAERLNADAWTLDQALLDRPGIDAVMLQYLWSYQDNLARYESWQAYLKRNQPATLIAWGKNDPFFTMAGVEALQALLPHATTELYDAGHFALETHAEEIAAATNRFLAANVR